MLLCILLGFVHQGVKICVSTVHQLTHTVVSIHSVFDFWTLPFILLSMNSLYRKDQCQSQDPPAPNFAPSFAAVAAGVDRNMEKDIHSKSMKQSLKLTPVHVFSKRICCAIALISNGEFLCTSSDVTGQYLPEETWSAPSIPLTNEFRYNTTEALPYIPQPATTASYNG